MMQSCDSTLPVNTDDPSNLVVEITQSEENPVLVIIEAQAENAVEYSLFIGAAEEPEDVNTSGLFEYTFSDAGYFQVEVRAYGTSGRYIKEVRQVVINTCMCNDVSIEDGYISPLTYEGYELVWNDEFDGSEIDPANWVFEIGTGCPNCGWGNNELEYYRKENAWLDDGVLVIEARKESYQGSSYTSARMKTEGKQSFQYGRIDIRALLPSGQGIWPALWMLGNNITSVGWPSCGEIDIMEMIGGADTDDQVHGTLHWDNSGHVYTGGSYTLDQGVFADEYHVFSMIWDQDAIQWFVNDTQFHEIDITPSHMAEFHKKFFLIFNVAVGGIWPGSPDGTTVFPQQMKVDYIRVFQ
ncbi:MAG: glycoside hydrolase family 16 protein [Bacteroidales bacterium]|nr:glycoside hydrolase family 16 protein [Bacteroidales bacterium]